MFSFHCNKYCRILWLLLASSSLCVAQNVNKELLLVHKDLKKIGYNITDLEWYIIDKNDELTIFESKKGHAFLIVANEEFRKFISNAIIAYSETNGFQGTESPWKKNLIHAYSKQLRKLRERGRIVEHRSLPFRFEKIHSVNVLPLLKTTWGQDYPYNEYCPTSINETTHNLTGCVATALLQVMYYHKYPTKGYGTFESGNDDGKYVINFEDQALDWKGMQLSYPQFRTKGLDIKPIAHLMSLNAKAVSSQFKITNTSSNYIAARSILVNHWGYSPSCKFMKNTDIAETCTIIADELNKKQPVLLSGGQHAFICDGYKDGYFHLNLGWRGAANGYYKFLLDENLQDKKTTEGIIKEIVFDICPDHRDKVLSKIVSVDIPGSLDNQLSLEEKKHLRKLSITGTLNGQDIALLRRMMGAADSWQKGCITINTRGKWTGELQDLDIENVAFVKDNKVPFLRMKATEGYFLWGKRKYHITDSIDNNEFEKILKTPLSHGKGFRYVLHQGDAFIEYYTLSDVISPLMFYDCQNLRQLKLPKGTKEILGNAFQWCSSLRNIELTSDIRYVEAGAFRECYLLTHITTNSKIIECCHNLFPLKTSGKYGEKDGNYHKGLFEGNNIHTCKGVIHKGEILRNIEYKIIY
ncbi:MAG: C10 family peptidase [Prevotellaceae bacterium]|nr:C10 family peptidase [Prevotellaceae bacterium]